MFRKSFLLIACILFMLPSCASDSYNFEWTKSLSDWYEEIRKMDSVGYWNAIPYPMPGTEGINVSRAILGDEFVIDFYFPPDHKPGEEVGIIITTRIFKMSEDFAVMGRRTLEEEYEISWAHLLAAEGWVVMKVESEIPSKSVEKSLEFIRENHAALGVDPNKVGFWSISSNSAAVIAFLAYGNKEFYSMIRCSAFLYPELKTSGMTSFTSLYHVPYFIAVGLNDSPSIVSQSQIFAENCANASIPYVYREHPTGSHGFDALSDDDTTREIITDLLIFYREHLN